MQINLLAAAVATVAGMLVGALWYGPLFGRAWRAAAALPPGHRPRRPAVVYGLALVATALTSLVIAGLAPLVAQGSGVAVLPAALATAAALWLGGCFSRQLVNVLFEESSVRLFLITTGHDLAVMTVVAVIIGLFGI